MYSCYANINQQNAVFTTEKDQNNLALSFTNSLVSMKRRFQLHFNVRYALTKKNIKDFVENFRRIGSILNYNRLASGRPVSVRTGEKIEAIRAFIGEDRNKSLGFFNETIIAVNNTGKTPQGHS